MSRALVINASPRGRQSNSRVLADAFLQGMEAAGVDVQTLYLADYTIKPCTGCFSCWGPTPHQCVIQDDDMLYLRGELAAVDYLVLAFPLYVDSMPGPLKTFFDRFIAVGEPWFEQDPAGETRHVDALRAPKMVVLSNCGFPENSHFEVLDKLFRRMARNYHTEVIGAVYRSQGGLLRSGSPELQPVIEQYLQNVTAAGRAVVAEGCISDSLQQSLQQPLLDKFQYLEAATQSFATQRPKASSGPAT